MDVDTTTWIVGFAVGGLIVVVVVAVVLAITATATRIRDQVYDIIAALRDAKVNTDPLWKVETTNNVGADILDLARQARHRLGG